MEHALPVTINANIALSLLIIVLVVFLIEFKIFLYVHAKGDFIIKIILLSVELVNSNA